MAVPVAPTALVATNGDDQVSIAFTQTAASPAISGFKYRIGAGGVWRDADPAITATPIVIKMRNGVAKDVYLRAVNADGDGAISALVACLPVDTTTNNDGYTDNTIFANPGMDIANLDINDPDD